MPSLFSNRIRCALPLAATLAVLIALAVSGCASTGKNSDAVSPDLAQDSSLAAEATASAPEVAARAVEDADATPARMAAVELDEDVADNGVPTEAELDFDALYGFYDPVADPNLPAAAQMPGAYDPWERYNRSMHRFNNAVDRAVARPLAKFYVAVTPRPVRLGVGNFFNNLGQPVTAVNALLQGKPGQAAHALGRFILNTTLGIGGLFDPATDANLDRRKEDFGQTLGVWGWHQSRYVELPLFGPRTVRDVFGLVGDAPLSPLRQISEDRTRIPLQGLQLVDVRTQLLATDSLREGASDDYALVRDAWLQRRNYQILGDRMGEDNDESLPEYLRDDDNPVVPAGAIPVLPADN